MNDSITSFLKNGLKIIHGGIYYLFLPLFIHPPERIYKGKVQSVTRQNVIRLLDEWKDQIHGNVLDVGVGTWTYPRSILQDRCQYTTTDFDLGPNIDITSDIHHLTDTFSKDSYDFVICTEVLEHIPRPWKAVKQLHAVLKPGGILLMTTPFNYRLHGNEKVKDYWRISADGLRQLLVEEAKFKTVEINAIGHPKFPFGHSVVAYK